MHVVNCDTPERGLELVRAPDPVAGPGEVIIDVTAAGVNRADLLQVAGRYPPAPGAPPWPGLEVSGVVSELGPPASGSFTGAGDDATPDAPGSALAVGDRVVALLAGGGYATRVAVPAGQVLPAPDGVDLVDAAALPEALATLWSTLVTGARLGAGDWLLLHGGAGGIGTTGIQLARALGARVAVTAGGPERVARCRELGADLAVDHRSEDFVAVVRGAAPNGVDVVLDVVGAAYLDRNLQVLATGGRLAVIGLQRGARAELDLGRLLARRLTVLGTTLRSRPPAEKAAILAALRTHVWPMVADGRVRPVVHARLPLAEATRAHRAVADGEVFGKLLLLPS